MIDSREFEALNVALNKEKPFSSIIVHFFFIRTHNPAIQLLMNGTQ